MRIYECIDILNDIKDDIKASSANLYLLTSDVERVASAEDIKRIIALNAKNLVDSSERLESIEKTLSNIGKNIFT